MSHSLYRPLGLGEGSVIAEKYTVAKIVGGDNQCILVEAFSPERGKSVLIRLFSAEATRPTEDARPLLQDLSQAKSISSPSLLSPLEVSKTRNDELYVAYENFRFVSLASELQTLQGQPYSVEETAHVMCEIAKALSAAHREGLPHYFLNPEEILLNEKGEVRLAGLGLGRIYRGDFSKPNTAFPESYRAPEQAERALGDTRSDLYSLGIIAYQMLLGFDPRADSSNAQKISSDSLEGLAASIAKLIDALIEENPEDRLKDVSSVHESLSEFLPQDPQTAQLAFQQARTERRTLLSTALNTRRLPAIPHSWLIAGVCSLGFLGLLSVFLLQNDPSSPSPHRSQPTSSSPSLSNVLKIPSLAKNNLALVEQAITGKFVETLPGENAQQRFIDTGRKIAITAPTGWDISLKPALPGMLVSFAAPDNPRPLQQPNFALGADPNPENNSLVEHAEKNNSAILLQMKEHSPEIVESLGMVRLENFEAVSSTIKLQTEHGSRYFQTYFIENKKEFLTLNFSYSDESKEFYQEYSKQIANSLERIDISKANKLHSKNAEEVSKSQREINKLVNPLK